jgi:hypothetical protein
MSLVKILNQIVQASNNQKEATLGVFKREHQNKSDWKKKSERQEPSQETRLDRRTIELIKPYIRV